MSRCGIFELAHLPLESGQVLRDAMLSYRVYGELNADRSNAILLPTYFTGNDASYEALTLPNGPFDARKWCVIVPNMFGNGRSTSPSNYRHAQASGEFPFISVSDNVRAQAALLDSLEIERVAIVGGWSLGAIQAFHWAAIYPARVDSVFAVCGTASCWPLNRAFLQGLTAILMGDPAFDNRSLAWRPATLKAYARSYCSWAYSAAFFRDEHYRRMGLDSPEAVMIKWERDHAEWNAFDLLAMMRTWASADITRVTDSAGAGRGLAAVRAECLIIPCDSDAYFRIEESLLESRQLQNARFVPLSSPFGHCAGAPGRFAEESTFIASELKNLLQSVRPAMHSRRKIQ